MVLVKIKKNDIAILLLYVITIRPNLYYFSSGISRVLELLTISVLIIYMLTLPAIKVNKTTRFILSLPLIYAFVIILSLTVNSNFYLLSFLDFAELFRPLIIGISFLFGVYLSCMQTTFSISKHIYRIGLINAFVAVIQSLNISISSVLYMLYNVPNLYQQGRPGGVCYSHIEYPLFAITCGVIGVYYYSMNKQKNILLGVTFIFMTSLLSASKAGVIFLASLAIFTFIQKIYRGSPSVKFWSLIVFLFCTIFFVIAIQRVPYLYMGFVDLLNFQGTTNNSIVARIHDFNIVVDIIKEFDYRFWIGSSPLRSYSNLSYIEITHLNIIFRFGVIGYLIYYSMLMLPALICLGKKSKAMLAFVIFAVVITDFTGNASETIKFSMLLFILIGYTLGTTEETFFLSLKNKKQ